MCGIAGLIYHKSLSLNPLSSSFKLLPGENSEINTIMRGMLSALHHRGPDGCGMWSGQTNSWNICLGHTRLAIIDLSDAAKQPMTDAFSGCVIVYNGEIYNFQTIREELLASGCLPFDSTGDTQVLLRAYIKWGPSFVNKLRGMFAFALYDPRIQQLFLARDHFGIKPLYITGEKRFFAFASEVRPLLQLPWVAKSLNLEGLAGYLSFGSVQEPNTLIEGITSLSSGHTLCMNLSQEELRRPEPKLYWDISALQNTDEPIGPEEACGHLREVLLDAIRLHLLSDAPLGVFLSGGMDSSSIAALMAEIAPSQVNSLTVSFDEVDYSEKEIAQSVAQRYSTHHANIHLTPDIFIDNLWSWLDAFDQPSADGANIWIVSKACKEAGIKVALSGLGGDELFGGYPTFARTALANRCFRVFDWIPRTIRSCLGQVIRTVGNRSIYSEKLAEWFASQGSHLEAYSILRKVMPKKTLNELIQGSVISVPDVAGLDKFISLFDSSKCYSLVSLFEINTYMRNTLLRDTDQMSMSHSIEVRVPFVDVEVMRSVFRLSESIRFDGKGNKPLLRRIMGDKLEPPWVDRPKMTFSLPFEKWFRGPLRKQVEGVLLQPSQFPFKPGALEKLWKRFLNNTNQVNSSQIMIPCVLNYWLNRHQIKSI